jgi:hypothetical protein
MPATLAELVSARRLKGLPRSVAVTLKNLDRLFPALVYRGPGQDDPTWFSRNLLMGGLFWESKIARFLGGEKKGSWNRIATRDLKGVLVTLEKHLRAEEDVHQSHSALRLGVEQCLDLIERDQFRNLVPLREELGWFWFIPGSEEQGFRWGEVLLRQNEKNEGSHFSLFMDFSRLGTVEAFVSISHRVVDLRILLEDAEALKLVSQYLHLLEQGLQRVGLIMGSLRCEMKEKGALDSTLDLDDGSPSTAVDLVI